mmetsp:Transcript_24299/g.43220  ORF Transcript_24299/g.43220 Transcript_24299/m.43220 type:complete len:207 (-) Transcript_24299:27-647(-)
MWTFLAMRLRILSTSFFINKMYIGPWQEFRLAKLLRMAEQSEIELPSRYYSSSPVRSKSIIPYKDFSYPKAIKKPNQLYLRLPETFQNMPSKPGSGFSGHVTTEVQTDATCWKSSRDDSTSVSRLSCTEDTTVSSITIKKRRPVKQLSLSTPKRSLLVLPPLRHKGDEKRHLLSYFENETIRENYPPLPTKPTLKGSTLKRRSRRM